MKKIMYGMFAFQLLATLTWVILIIPSVTIWRQSIEWVVFMSVWANCASHGAGLVGAILAIYEYRKDNQ